MAKETTAEVKIKAVDETGKAIASTTKRFETATAKFESMGKRLQTVGKRMSLFVTAPLVGLGILAVKTASDMEEVESKFDAVFKHIAKETKDWADDFGIAVGRSRKDIYGWMAALQDTFVPLGYSREEGAKLSKVLTQLTVDVASFNNAVETDVLRDFQSAIVGNHETVRKYGIIMTQATLDQELLNMGIKGGMQVATEQQKVMARVNMIMKGTTDAQGDAIRTAGSFANQMRALKSSFQEVLIAVGEYFIPVLSKLIEHIKKGMSWFRNLSDEQKQLVIKIGLVVAAVGPLIMMFGFLITTLGAILTPVGLVVAAIGALGALAFLIWKNWDKVSTFLKDLWNDLADFANKIFQNMKLAVLIPVREILEFLLKIASSFKKVFKKIDVTGIENALGKINLSIDETHGKIEDLGPSFEKTGEHLKKAGEKVKGLIDKVKGLAQQFKGLSLGQGVVVESTGDVSKAVVTYTEDTEDVIEVLERLNRATIEVKGANEILLESITDVAQEYKDKAMQMVNDTQWMAGQITMISGQLASNRQTEIDNWYNYEKDRIENSVINEEDRVTQLEALDAEKRAMERDLAIQKKKVALFSAIVDTAAGVASALAQGGFLLGIPWALIVGALGAAKIAAISAQPLPLAQGAVVTEPTLAMVGEKGPEAVIPLSKSGLGVTIIVQGSVIRERELISMIFEEGSRIGYTR